ncbi:MAG: hypothetical protein DHS20C19_20610 [Acidimicrobiales bacterium]|nr:MAG: hypothetical protein DHS20C19_20610 [Acidimicrobiales bacterium]
MTTPTGRARARLLALLAAIALVLAACGDDTETSDPTPDPGAGSSDDGNDDGDGSTDDADPPADLTTDDVLVALAASGLGDILVDGAGLSLYGFTNDVDGVPACYDACADAWPPILVDGALDDGALGAGLDAAVFSTVERTDGTNQLVAGTWPLYLFAGDGAPGDVNGQGSGDVWFLAAPDGSLIGRDAPTDDEPATDEPAFVDTATTDAGDVLVDENGLSLYGFTNDVDGVPTCFDACADAWPAVSVDGMALPEGLDAAIFSIVDRGDGTYQLAAGSWPLYRFAGDGAAGDINGQGVGGVWFLAAPDGSLIGRDAPAGDEAAAAPASDY